MKKTLICMLTVMTFLFLSCQNTADPAAEKPNSVTIPSATTPAGEGGGSGAGTGTGGGSGQSPISIGGDGTVTIISRNLVSLGETTETLNSVSYTVKKYADVYVESPYFYTYYKLYYSNNKLRRVFTYYHDLQCEMDYKYDEFVDHVCKKRRANRQIHEISTYYENGKLQSYYCDFVDGQLHGSESGYDINGREIYSKSFDNNVLSSETRKEYDSHGRLTSEKTYRNEVLTSETQYTYYDNGKERTAKLYSNNTLTSEYEYYETGRQKSYKNYQNGNLSSETEYYTNGSQKVSKHYWNGVLLAQLLYFQGSGSGGSGQEKGNVQYNSNTGNLTSFTIKYPSGYLHYYYTSGFFYTFEDNQYNSVPTNLTEGTAYTEAQALAKLEELKNEN